MRNRRIISVIAVIAILAVAAIAWTRFQTTLAARIPPEIRKAVMAHYGSQGGVSLRAYSVQGDHSFVVTEFRYPPGVEWMSYDFFRINATEQLKGIIPQPMRWHGGQFEAGCSFSSDSMGHPYQVFAVGVAFDRAISRVVGITADGRITEAEVFSGFWWATAPLDKEGYERDLWARFVAYDAKGNVLYECAAEYPSVH